MTTAQVLDIDQLQNENAELHCEILLLKEQLAWLKRQIFGKRSEKILSNLNESQLEFDGFDDQALPEQKVETVPAHTRRKPNRNGQDKIALPSDVPVETIVLDATEEEKKCPETGEPLIKIGEEISMKLAQKPGTVYVKKIIRPKYAHPGKEELGVVIASMPDSIIPKCRADESFLAEVATRKFADHLPLYRISEMFAREGVGISRKLLSQWMVRLGEALRPIHRLMMAKIFASRNIFIDESPVRIIEDESKLGYMWTIVGGEGPSPPYRIYFFREDRRHEHVVQMLQGYDGVLHSDKYGAYETLAQKKQIVWSPCWAHIRRKFIRPLA
jgi:transposase